MSERSSPAHPECILVQFFRDPLWLKSVLATEKGLKHFQGSFNQATVGEHATVASNSRVGMDCDQRVDRVLWLDFR
jgi:hypothetical protein